MSPASGVDIRTIVPDYIMSLYRIDTVHLGERGQYVLNRLEKFEVRAQRNGA